MAASLGFGLLAGLIVFYLLTRRLRSLSGLMEDFALVHDLPAEAGAPDADEINHLTRTFQRMARRIDEQIERLKTQDGLRRRFIAQISHDLRTPLSSMLGYLESVQMKQTALPEEQRRAFLDTAMRQGRRLNRLIEALFELSSLDAQESEPDKEAFSIAELLYDVAQKHQLRAQERGIALHCIAGRRYSHRKPGGRGQPVRVPAAALWRCRPSRTAVMKL